MTKLAVFVSNHFPNSGIFIDFWYIRVHPIATAVLYWMNVIAGAICVGFILYWQYMEVYLVTDAIISEESGMRSPTRQNSLFQWILCRVIVKLRHRHGDPLVLEESLLSDEQSRDLFNEQVESGSEVGDELVIVQKSKSQEDIV